MKSFRWFVGLAVLALAACDNTIRDHFSASGIVDLAKPASISGTPVSTGLSVHLSWVDNATGESGYRLEGDQTPFGGSPPAYSITLPAGSTGADVSTQPNTTYYFRVFAVSGAQDSPPSDVVAVTTPNVPFPPLNLTATAISNSRIDLAWANPAGTLTGNRVERSVDGGTTWSTRFTFGAPTIAASDTGLNPDSEYFYRVTASNANGEGGASVPASATTLTNAVTIRTTSTPTRIVGQHTSIAVSAAGVAHIAHHDATNADLLYSNDSSDPLPVSTIDTGPTGTQAVGGDGTGIALDASGHLHLVAHDATNDKLRYATNANGSFEVSTLEAAGFKGRSPRIAVSPVDGTLHVLYLNDLAGADNLRHATRTPPSTTWTFEDILPAATTLDFWSLTVDASGHPQVSYTHTDDGIIYELVYGTKVASWSFSPITNTARPGRNSIAVDAGGVPHIAYYEQTNMRLIHAARSGSAWTTEVVHGTAGVDLGQYNAIVLNASTGRIHIAYSDVTHGDLLYARKDPGGVWVRKALDAVGNVGAYPSVGLDGSGQVFVGYFDAGNGELKLAVGIP